MKKFIENLQNQPVSVRRRFAVVCSVSVFVCIVLLWSVSFVYGLRNRMASPDVVEVYKEASPFASLTNNFGNNLAAIRENFVEIFSKGPGTPPDAVVSPAETAPADLGL
jgi:hypothetical protein